MGDQLIKAGQMVTVMIAAANRDPRKYDEAQTLQIDRPNPSPLSFGHGVHYCIGAALSRTTTRIGMTTFLETWPGYRLALDDVTWRTSTSLRGPMTLPALLT